MPTLFTFCAMHHHTTLLSHNGLFGELRATNITMVLELAMDKDLLLAVASQPNLHMHMLSSACRRAGGSTTKTCWQRSSEPITGTGLFPADLEA